MKKAQIIPHFLDSYRNGLIRVGFSGGSDSTALLLLLLKWQFAARQLEAVHFDHGLRGDASTADGQWCRDFCARLGIKFTLVKLDLAPAIAGGDSLEDAARNARLDWYRTHDNGAAVALAHHADDVQENMLLKLARGGNVSTLTSLRSVRKLWNLTILRPLLDWHKYELEDFLRSENIHHWRHDASNDSSDYHRNFLRNDLLRNWADYHPPLPKGLDTAACVLAMDADFIEQAAAEKTAELGECMPRKTDTNFWLNMHPALFYRVLRTYLVKISGQTSVDLSNQSVENFRNILQTPGNGKSRNIVLNKFFNFKLTGKILEFIDPAAETVPLTAQNWFWRSTRALKYGNWQLRCELLPGAVCGKQDGCFYFDAAGTPEPLICTTRQGGEKMSVWGSPAPRHVKHLLSGITDKSDMILLQDSEHNIYLLGNYRRSILAPVTADTCMTLKIQLEYTPAS